MRSGRHAPLLPPATPAAAAYATWATAHAPVYTDRPSAVTARARAVSLPAGVRRESTPEAATARPGARVAS